MSDIVPAKKAGAWVKEWVSDVHAAFKPTEQAVSTPVTYTKSAGSTLAQYVGGATLGSLLGATHAKFGLDTAWGPVEGWIAGLGALFSVGLAKVSPMWAAVARKAGNDAVVVWTFRKGYEVVRHAPLEGGSASTSSSRIASTTSSTPHGEKSGRKIDRIEAVAREVNL